MPAYIILINWTQEGIKDVKQSPDRLDKARSAFQAVGAELKECFLVMGKYDLVVIAEAPDDETIARLALTIGRKGATRTETLRAFTEGEYRKIIAALD